MCEFEAQAQVAIGAGIEGVVEFVGGELGAVNVLVEEPVHFVIAFEIHTGGHVFFDHRLEIFGGGRLAAVGVDEILHHGFELLIAGLVVVHHHAKHV